MNRARLVRIGLLLVLLLGIALAVAYRGHLNAAALQGWVQSSGVAAPLVFVLIYAAAALLFIPGSVITLAGGALFGAVLGTIYSLTGATLGASTAFLLARYVGADWVERKTGGRLKQLKQGVESEGWRFVAFVRLMPLFPFNLLNYALGVTRIKFTHYVLATFIFMAPGAFAYSYLGYAGRETVAGGQGLIQKILIALALLAVLAFLPRLIAQLRQKPMMEVEMLRQRLERGDDVLVVDVRSPQEFVGELGHIAGAINIPLDQLAQRRDELSDYQERTVTLVCRTDRRSVKAARLLSQTGFGDLHVLRGGMMRWQEVGYPILSTNDGAAAPI